MRNLIIAGFGLWASVSWSLALPDFCKFDVEGTYTGKIGSSFARVNIVCLEGARLHASIYPFAGKLGAAEVMDTVQNLTHIYMDGNNVILADFEVDGASRISGSSKSWNFYLRLDDLAFFSNH